ncbi:MAG: glycosyltransferase family 2 protein [Anaerolineae bacterium]|nr:glycosyltransferase family 2 protein [Anaerolineae bacterium]
MFCSIIIPTVGRQSLSDSVTSVLEQNFTEDNFEIIVVNDSGHPLSAEKWQNSEQVQIITTQQRERCFARNTGAAIAQGDYFCFLDDDDWLLPNALEKFWHTIKADSRAGWVYGSVQFVDDAGKPLGNLNQNKSGNCFLEAMTETWIPLQTSLIKADAFFHVGGFDPDFIVTQDLDLLRRIAFHYDLISIPDTIACIRRGNSRKTGTKYTLGWYYIAKGRDNLLAQQDALPALLKSANGSAYSHGLVLRNYKSAMLFNLRRHHWLNAASRFSSGLMSCLKSLNYVFAKEYWMAVMDTRPLHLTLINNLSSDYSAVEEWLYS